MSKVREAARPFGMSWRSVALLAVGAGVALLLAANAHLVYVAFDSQPDCVPHAKSAGESGMFRAARSAC
jgi:hypothetical protein